MKGRWRSSPEMDFNHVISLFLDRVIQHHTAGSTEGSPLEPAWFLLNAGPFVRGNPFEIMEEKQDFIAVVNVII